MTNLQDTASDHQSLENLELTSSRKPRELILPCSLLSDFIASGVAKSKFNDRTCAAYADDLRQWVSFLAENSNHSSAEPHKDINEEFNRLILSAGSTHVTKFLQEILDRGIAEATLRRKSASIQSLYSYLLKQGLISISPTHAANRPAKSIETRSVRISPDQFYELMTALDDTFSGRRLNALLWLVYGTVAKPSDILAVNISDIVLSKSFFDGGENSIVYRRGSKSHKIPLTLEAHVALQEYLLARAHFLSAYGIVGSTADQKPLFINKVLEPISERSMRRFFESLVQSMGGAFDPETGFHDILLLGVRALEREQGLTAEIIRRYRISQRLIKTSLQ